MKLTWVNFLHVYQPPDWDPKIIRKVSRESYEPLFAFLHSHPSVRITLNMSGVLLEQLLRHNITEPLDALRALVRKGQVELVGTAKFHPLAPLLPFQHVERQIRQHADLLREYIGIRLPLAGFFPPEMAVTPEFLLHIAKFGFSWVILDDFLIPNGQSVHPGEGAVLEKTNLRLVFRSHIISDYFGFFVSSQEPIAHFHKLVEKETKQSSVVITAMDGENLGHHRPDSLLMWSRLVTNPDIEAITVSELLERQRGLKEITPASGSWSTLPDDLHHNIPFPLWKDPENPIHAMQWRLTETILGVIERVAPDDLQALETVDRALVSDQYWWASARPWWDRDLVIRLADRLADSVATLTLTEVEQELIRETVKEIHATANEWQEKGIAEKRRAAFLAKESGVRYFGGERVSETWTTY